MADLPPSSNGFTVNSIKHRLKSWIKGPVRDFYWDIYGNTVKNPECPDCPRSFLFVCKGNICRSPFAEKIAEKLVGSFLPDGGQFSSAGLEALLPLAPPPEVTEVAECFGIRLENHRSKRINRILVEAFDMVLVMEAGQLQALKRSFPHHHHKLFLLPLFHAGEGNNQKGYSRYNIADPYGRSPDQFHDCFRRIEECVQGLFETIQIESSNKARVGIRISSRL